MYVCICMCVYFECAKRMFSFRSCQHALYNRSCNTSGGGHLGECCGQQSQLSKDSDGLDSIHQQPSSRLQGGDPFGMYVCMYICMYVYVIPRINLRNVVRLMKTETASRTTTSISAGYVHYWPMFVCMYVCIYYIRVTVIYGNIMHSM